MIPFSDRDPDEVDRDLVHFFLSALDPDMLTSADGKRVTVSLEAIRKLLERNT